MDASKERRPGAPVLSQQKAPLSQSRELGGVVPEPATVPPATTKESPFAKSWPHLVAGGYVNFIA